MEYLNRYRLLILLSSWSYDYWDEINHENPEDRIPDEGPDQIEIVLCSTFNEIPPSKEIKKKLNKTTQILALGDGKRQFLGYLILDKSQWAVLVQQSGHSENTQPDTTNIWPPTIRYYNSRSEAESIFKAMHWNFVQSTQLIKSQNKNLQKWL